MGLIRNFQPTDQPLSEYYARMPDDGGFFLGFLERLDAKLGDLPVYVTSDRASLWLQSHPGGNAVGWVKIIPEAPLPEVTLGGTAPDRYMPFAGAMITTIPASLEDAVEKVLILMEYSEGWTEEKRNWNRSNLDKGPFAPLPGTLR